MAGMILYRKNERFADRTKKDRQIVWGRVHMILQSASNAVRNALHLAVDEKNPGAWQKREIQIHRVFFCGKNRLWFLFFWYLEKGSKNWDPGFVFRFFDTILYRRHDHHSSSPWSLLNRLLMVLFCNVGVPACQLLQWGLDWAHE